MRYLEKFEKHDNLNPKLWKDNKLIPEVRNKITEIVEQFLLSCDFSLTVVDIRIVGSQASYNYTDYSDLDVHIISNFELIDANSEIIQLLCNAVKAKFNSDYEITIKDIDVELYVEDMNSNVASNGIYSVLNDRWIKFPNKIDNIPDIDISDQLEEYESRIKAILSGNNSDAITNIIDELYLIRKDSIAEEGEYGSGNQLFKEIRNLGLLDQLKDKYKKIRSKELTLEHVQLTEASRNKLITKSKQSQKGLERFKKRVKSRVANTVKQYNSIDMNKLFKDNILTIDVNVKGETDDYIVRISFGGFLELLHDQLKKNPEFNLKAVTRALIIGFNRDDVYIKCSCPDWQYRYAYYATKNDINSGDPETRPSDITNPDDKLGSACKHVLLVLSNTSWLLKVASTIYNYVNYMEKHYLRLYQKILYPAIWQKEYEEPVQLTIDDIEDNNEMDTSTDIIDKSNEYARTKQQFKKGNKEGVRFASNKSDDENQLTIDDAEELDDAEETPEEE